MLIGVDFGGTQVKAGIVENGEVVRSTATPTRAGSSAAEVFDTIASTVLALSSKPDAVGVAIPGEVNSEGRCWRLPNVPGFEGVHIAEELAKRLRCPIAVENDATTAALGERLYGHGREHPSFLMLTLGTGVGGGLVLGHQLYPGANGFAAEIGHMKVDTSPEAPLCACGQRGCVETFAGTRALLREYARQGGQATEVLPIAVSARRGEPAGLRTFEMMGSALGRLLANIQNLLDLNAVVFSGGISASFDLIEPYVRDALRAHAFAPPLSDVPLLVSELGERAGVIGAAHLTQL
ncbi:MAG TPA: ROK family protein [Polyangiaceae bacterium]|jgi:glucokinase|nr:ROK family protein [Polyangiaceae bacterium]